MTIEDKLKSVDVKLMLIKLELNSNYGVSYGISFHSIMDEMYILKKQKSSLLKKKERLDKLKKIMQ